MTTISYLTQLHPRQPKYTSDGQGRDYYIFHNNGGFNKNVSLSHRIPNFNLFRYKSYCNTKRNVAPLKYRSDGTGRDSYILKEHGGFERDFKSLREHNFRDYLRVPGSTQYASAKMSKDCSPMARTIYISQGEMNRINSIKTIEKDLVKRLYWKEKSKFMKNTMYNK
jgi:hypothetical protein